MKTLLRFCLCFTAIAASAQHLVDQKTFDAIATEYSGEAAQENTRRIVEYHRIQGSPMMAAVADQVVLPRLKAAGLDHIQLSFQDSTQELNDFLSSTRTFDLKRRVGSAPISYEIDGIQYIAIAAGGALVEAHGTAPDRPARLFVFQLPG